MSETHIIAILSPKPGALEKIVDVLKEASKGVHEKEEGKALRYVITEQIGVDNPDVIIFETYKDKEASEQHAQEPHVKKLFGALVGEELLSKPPYLATTVSKAGFELDRKLINKL